MKDGTNLERNGFSGDTLHQIRYISHDLVRSRFLLLLLVQRCRLCVGINRFRPIRILITNDQRAFLLATESTDLVENIETIVPVRPISHRQ